MNPKRETSSLKAQPERTGGSDLIPGQAFGKGASFGLSEL